MALQAWYPFNGNCKNQGTGDLELNIETNPTYVDSGKIGKALSTGKLYWTASQTASILNNQKLSIAFWVYPAKEPTEDAPYNNCIFGNEVPIEDRRFSIFMYPTINDLYISWCSSDDDKTPSFVETGAFPSFKWTHVAITYDNPTCKIYINGKLIRTQTIVYNISSFADETTVINNSENRYINDFRVYDHVLSEKEIKLISQGMLIHFPMNTKTPLVNLEKNKTYGIYNNFQVPATLVALNEKYQGCTVYRLTMTPTAEKVTHFRETLHSHGIMTSSRYTFKPNTEYCYWIYYRPVTHKDIRVGGVASNVHNWVEIAPEYYKDGWYRVGQHGITSDQEALDYIFTSFLTPTAEADVPISVDFCCPHYVEGVNHIIEEEGYQYDYPEPVIYNTTGLGPNGSVNSRDMMPTFVKDSPRYDGSYLFNYKEAFRVNNLFTKGYKDSWTIAYWAKTSVPDGRMAWSFNGNNLNVIGSASVLCMNTGDSGENPFQLNGVNTPTPNGNWHHYAITGDGTQNILYLDGVKAGIAKTYRPITGDTLKISGWAKNSDDNDIYLWNGNISDFRLYTTALSEVDVKDLYSVSASITSNGALLVSGEVIEK